MGYDMVISVVDKLSVDILSNALNRSREDILTDSLLTGFPIMYDPGESVTDIFGYAKICGVSLNSILLDIKSGLHNIIISTVKEITYSPDRTLDDYFKNCINQDISNDGVYIFTDETYKQLLDYCEKVMRETSLYDVYVDSKILNVSSVIENCTDLLKCNSIDFDKYIVYFTHNW